jgi:hypothetical protein
MDFIKVTLLEKIDADVNVSSRQMKADYLLPVNAIRSLFRKESSESNEYWIEILDGFRPIDAGFNVGHAEAILPPDFITVLN